MFLDRPNHFGQVPIILNKSNLFWLAPNHFEQAQIMNISPEKSNLNLTKIILTQPKQKQFGWSKIILCTDFLKSGGNILGQCFKMRKFND
jgi:hypothetical protein